MKKNTLFMTYRLLPVIAFMLLFAGCKKESATNTKQTKTYKLYTPVYKPKATALASSPTVFSNPALYSVLTAQVVKGIIVYHIFGNRAFTNNFPTTSTFYPTLLNGGIPSHPGLSITATFGAPFVSAATIKGIANASAANIIINGTPLLPDPIGTSDQHYLNGVIHKIDQVLLPQ